MTFLINNPYNPGEHAYSDSLQEAIFAALYYNKNTQYKVIIEDGFYRLLVWVVCLENAFGGTVVARRAYPHISAVSAGGYVLDAAGL